MSIVWYVGVPTYHNMVCVIDRGKFSSEKNERNLTPRHHADTGPIVRISADSRKKSTQPESKPWCGTESATQFLARPPSRVPRSSHPTSRWNQVAAKSTLRNSSNVSQRMQPRRRATWKRRGMRRAIIPTWRRRG